MQANLPHEFSFLKKYHPANMCVVYEEDFLSTSKTLNCEIIVVIL